MNEAPGVELHARLVDQVQRLADFAGMGQHGHQQVDLAVGGGAQNGTQLRQKHRRIGQAPADGAQPERRVQVAFLRLGCRPVQGLVGADIDGADGHRQALHAFDGLAVGQVLLVLVGQLAIAAHEQKFAAEQPHAHRAGLDRAQRVVGHFDIGQQLDALPVQRQRRGVAQAVEPLALEFALALLEAVFGQDDGRRIDDQHAGIAVDDHPVVLLDQLAGAARADHRRNVHAARDDGGVRGTAAHVGGKAGKQTLLELQHVGRRNVVRHQHQRHIERVVEQQVLLRLPAAAAGPRRALAGRLQRRGRAFHVAQDALDDLLQVGFALAQIGVLHLVELTRNQFVLRGQRPFGVVVALGDPVLDAADQHFVLQQHQVHVEQRGDFMRRVLGQVVLQTHDFFHDRIARQPDARNLVIGGGRVDEVMADIGPARRHQHRTANRHAARHRQAVDGERHSEFPERSAGRCKKRDGEEVSAVV